MKKVVILGGGLWGGLLAYRLQMIRPELEFVIHEATASLGGNHTWSFHESDVSRSALQWLSPFIRKTWPQYKVIFPKYERNVNIGYHSIDSEKFHSAIVNSLNPARIKLNSRPSPEDFPSNEYLVVDARGISPDQQSGFQKFYGMEIKTKAPHRLTSPILMDATVEQIDGFRFFYVLPFDEETLLIEDTRYSDNPVIDSSHFKEEILNYAAHKEWHHHSITRYEKGVLPIPFYQSENSPEDGSVNLSGIFHDVTGYSLPDAVKVADLLAADSLNRWHALIRTYKTTNTGNRNFYCLLNRLMFHASGPQERYRVLEFFYRSSPSSIQKFYAGNLSSWDKIKFFAGKPPVQISDALKVIFARNRELECTR